MTNIFRVLLVVVRRRFSQKTNEWHLMIFVSEKDKQIHSFGFWPDNLLTVLSKQLVSSKKLRMNIVEFCFLKNYAWCLENCTFHISAMLSFALKGET